ncbi:MAG: hypothetical protein ABII75_06010 [Candidatus Omnitrophota bacterium]
MNTKNIFLLIVTILIIWAIVFVSKQIEQHEEKIGNQLGKDLKGFSYLFIKGSQGIKRRISKDTAKDFTSTTNAKQKEFNQLFFIGSTESELAEAIKVGSEQLKYIPSNLELRGKLAFLYYIKGNRVQSQKHYRKVLGKFRWMKREFENLKQHKNYQSIKRTLLGLSALYMEEDFDEMADYYKQYLKVSFRKEIYEKMMNEGWDDYNIKMGIIAELAGEGIFSYQKAIELLEKLKTEYPEHTEKIVYKLSVYNYELINLMRSYDIALAEKDVDCARTYLEEVLKTENFSKRSDLLLKLADVYAIGTKYSLAAGIYKEVFKMPEAEPYSPDFFNEKLRYIDVLRNAKMFDEGILEIEALIAEGKFGRFKEKLESLRSRLYMEKSRYDRSRTETLTRELITN